MMHIYSFSLFRLLFFLIKFFQLTESAVRRLTVLLPVPLSIRNDHLTARLFLFTHLLVALSLALSPSFRYQLCLKSLISPRLPWPPDLISVSATNQISFHQMRRAS